MRFGSRSSRRRGGASPFAVGLFALLIIAVGIFLGFTKDIPFTKGYRIKAVFESANSLRPNSPVRIAGVNVGKVKSVSAAESSNAAVVEMEIDEEGLPIHQNATAKIRPRIFLEGNFFVDLTPGTPGAPVLADGDTIKITQTARPVQLDEVLTSLQDDTREDLQDVLAELGTALSDKPDPEQDEDVDQDVRGLTGAEALNKAADDAGPALRAGAEVNSAFLGVEPDRDIQRLLAGFAATAEGLTRNEQSLKDFVTNFNRTLAAFAAEEVNLRATIRELAPTLEAANPALDALNASFPDTRALARELIPGVNETPASIAAARPFISEARKLLGPNELRGVVRELAPATADLAAFTEAQIRFVPQLDLISRCALDVVLPTGDVVIKDEFTTGEENYKEFAYGLVGLAGEGQNFDGNGLYVRFQPGGGSQTVSVGSESDPGGRLFGNAVAAPLGSRPRYPGKRPPYRNEVPCHTNDRPDLNGPAAAKGPGDTVSASGQPGSTTEAINGIRELLDSLLPARRRGRAGDARTDGPANAGSAPAARDDADERPARSGPAPAPAVDPEGIVPRVPDVLPQLGSALDEVAGR